MEARKEDHSDFSLAHLESILDNIVDGLITINEQGIVQSYNKACQKIFGYAPEEVIGQNIKILMPDSYAHEHDQYLTNYMHGGHAKIIGIGREVQGRRKDGTVFPIDLSVAQVKVGQKRIFSGIVRDITARKKVEEDIIRSNRDLEQFAYIASHDLKAPLRNIDDLAKWVMEDHHDSLPGEAEEKLKLMRVRVARLETLLDDILAYSRAGRMTGTPTEIDIDALLENLAQTHIPASFKLRICSKLPRLVTYHVPLEQVFANIISNAVKHHDRGEGVIEIEYHQRGNLCEFIVQDDGPGIPPEYHERVFGMFQTLKSRDQVKGSGIGMALIKKLVEWQGGRIWIESVQDQRGTAIHFHWPQHSAIDDNIL